MRMVPLRAAEPSLPEQMRAEHLGCPVVEVGGFVSDVGSVVLHRMICCCQPWLSQKICCWQGCSIVICLLHQMLFAAVQTQLDGQLYWLEPT